MLFASVNAANADFGPVWLVPSHEFSRHAVRTSYEKFRFSASAKETSADKWRRIAWKSRGSPPHCFSDCRNFDTVPRAITGLERADRRDSSPSTSDADRVAELSRAVGRAAIAREDQRDRAGVATSCTHYG